MKQDQLFVLLSIVIAMTGILLIVDVLPQFFVVPLFVLEYGGAMGGSFGGFFLSIALPLATVLVGSILILRRFNIAEKLAYVEFVNIAAGDGTEQSTEVEGQVDVQNDVEAAEASEELVAGPAADDHISDMDDEVFRSDGTMRTLWGSTAPKVAIAVLGFYLAAGGLVSVISVLAKVLLVRDAGSLEPSLSLVGPEFTTGLEGVVKLLVAFLLITRYSGIIKAWNRVWGDSSLR